MATRPFRDLMAAFPVAFAAPLAAPTAAPIPPAAAPLSSTLDRFFANALGDTGGGRPILAGRVSAARHSPATTFRVGSSVVAAAGAQGLLCGAVTVTGAGTGAGIGGGAGRGNVIEIAAGVSVGRAPGRTPSREELAEQARPIHLP